MTDDDRIKILDFGLAKLIGPDSSPDTRDRRRRRRAAPMVMGTVTYMSPEQARGHRIDHRTDIFSFGVVLYEMLCGFPPFQRATHGDTLNAILHDEPEEIPRDRPVDPCARANRPPLPREEARGAISELP